jgi:hypothetical protein
VRKWKRTAKFKNNKGLKRLSANVYDLVVENSPTTYNEVADGLIKKIKE